MSTTADSISSKLLLTALLLSFTARLVASEKMPAHPAFYSSKTLAIINDSGYASIGDKAYDELRSGADTKSSPIPESPTWCSWLRRMSDMRLYLVPLDPPQPRP